MKAVRLLALVIALGVGHRVRGVVRADRHHTRRLRGRQGRS